MFQTKIQQIQSSRVHLGKLFTMIQDPYDTTNPHFPQKRISSFPQNVKANIEKPLRQFLISNKRSGHMQDSAINIFGLIM